MSRPEETSVAWDVEDGQARTLARNVSGCYASLAVETLTGFLVLPFNVRHLGASEYGLWMLVASMTAYFPLLDLGYRGGTEWFVAHYRAKRDANAINEIASTLFVVFTAIGIAAYAVVVLLAFNLGRFFNLTPDQVSLGRAVLLIISLPICLTFPFGVFGAVINSFQKYHLNTVVASVTALVVTIVNVAVLLSGHGLVMLVAATSVVRLLSYAVYRLNAYRVFPLLRVRPSLFRRARLREISGFSAYMFVQNVAQKMNYAVDALVIGVFMTTAAVAVWTVAQRLADTAQKVTNQLNEVLFPIVVDCDATQRDASLRQLLLQATRVSAAVVVPVAGALALLARPVVLAWVGPEFAAAVPLVQLLAIVAAVRVATSPASLVLRGAGHIRLLSLSSLAAAGLNLAVSVALVGRFGLLGVAVGTLAPIAALGCFVVFPAACRRVGLTATRGFRLAVWPALWPAAIALGLVLVTSPLVGTSLLACAVEAAMASLVHFAIFFGLGLKRADQRLYLAKLREVVQRTPRLQTAGG